MGRNWGCRLRTVAMWQLMDLAFWLSEHHHHDLAVRACKLKDWIAATCPRGDHSRC